MAATSGPAGTTVELVLAALVVSHCGHGRFLLQSFPVIIGSGCRAVGWKTTRNRNDNMDNKDNDNDNKSRHTMMLHSIIVASRGMHVVASSSSLSSAAADDDDNAPNSVGIYCHHHCSRGDNDEATRVLRRCASKGRGEATINLGDGIVWSFPRLHCGCCGHCFFVVVVGCQGCVVLSRGCCSCIVVVVVMLSFPMAALWLLRLRCCFPQLRHRCLQLECGCCSCCVLWLWLVVAVDCCSIVVALVPVYVLFHSLANSFCCCQSCCFCHGLHFRILATVC